MKRHLDLAADDEEHVKAQRVKLDTVRSLFHRYPSLEFNPEPRHECERC